MRGDDLRDLAFDQVVRHQEVLTVRSAMKDVQHVLAVRSGDQFFELQAVDVDVEHAGAGRREVEAAGKDDAFAAREEA